MSNIDLYKLGHSETHSIKKIGEEVRIDLQLSESNKSKSGTVYGTITDKEGVPIEGATIKIMDSYYNPINHSITDDTGKYTINNLIANTQYEIFAVKEHYTLNKGISFVVRSNQSIKKDFILENASNIDTSIITGEVIDINGKNVRETLVELYDIKNIKYPVLLKYTNTNIDGQFSFYNMKKGKYMTQVTKLGYKTNKLYFEIKELNIIKNLLVTLAEDPMTQKGIISGTIKDNKNNPIENAFVILFKVDIVNGKEELTPIRKTVTNKEGIYLFSEVDYGQYKIKANKTIVGL